ncbi:hypothetical protein [Sphingomonas morindae]|nr:hypothetical protein [Sphingomonas morindae]
MIRAVAIGVLLQAVLPSAARAAHGGINPRPGDLPDCWYEKAVV